MVRFPARGCMSAQISSPRLAFIEFTPDPMGRRIVRMKFAKMHGLGNDYVCVDCFEQSIGDPAALARTLSERHTGIGGDGLILIRPSDVAEVRMEMYNADGSRAEMCGNGIRCVAKYAVEHGLIAGPDLGVETDAGVKPAQCDMIGAEVRSVRVDMGPPTLTAEAIPTSLGDGKTERIIDHPLRIGCLDYLVTCVSMGNPHAVVFVDDLQTVALEVVGPRFEHAPQFPKRINVHFVYVDSPARVTMRTWERGSGPTRACGTGACAVCVAGTLTNRTARAITAELPGGQLHVQWADDNHV